MPPFVPLIDRISVDEKTGCWNWMGGKNSYGYGETTYKGKPRVASRLSAHLWLGMDIEDPRNVCHKCDNPACFNPKYLFIGTDSDNMQDCVRKGRFATRFGKVDPLFYRCGHSKTEENTYHRLWRGLDSKGCKKCTKIRSSNYRKDKRRI